MTAVRANAALIERFRSAFARRGVRAMLACFRDDVQSGRPELVGRRIRVRAARRSAAQAAAAPFNLPVMIHVGQNFSPMRAILALLKRGDIVTHMYAPPPNSILDDQGRLFPDVTAARRRGVIFDFGNGAAVISTGIWWSARRDRASGPIPSPPIGMQCHAAIQASSTSRT